MLILVKPELENQIIMSDFAMVMENFGIGAQTGRTNEKEEPEKAPQPA